MNTLVATTTDPNAVPLGLLLTLGVSLLILVIGIRISSRVSKSIRALLYLGGFAAAGVVGTLLLPNLFNNEPITDMTVMFTKLTALTAPLYFLMGTMIGGMHAGIRKTNTDLLDGWQSQLTADQAAGKDEHVIVADLISIGQCHQRLGQKKEAVASFDAAYQRLKTTGEHRHPSRLDFLIAYRDLLSGNGRKAESTDIQALIASIPTALQVSLTPRRS